MIQQTRWDPNWNVLLHPEISRLTAGTQKFEVRCVIAQSPAQESHWIRRYLEHGTYHQILGQKWDSCLRFQRSLQSLKLKLSCSPLNNFFTSAIDRARLETEKPWVIHSLLGFTQCSLIAYIFRYHITVGRTRRAPIDWPRCEFVILFRYLFPGHSVQLYSLFTITIDRNGFCSKLYCFSKYTGMWYCCK